MIREREARGQDMAAEIGEELVEVHEKEGKQWHT